MGYETWFSGSYEIQPKLTPKHLAYLNAFCETRRVNRDVMKMTHLPDPLRVAVGLPLGAEGGYYVGSVKDGISGQRPCPSVLDSNGPPRSQPTLWCPWIFDSDAIEGEDGKAYEFKEWLDYLISHFLEPWGYKVNGCVNWDGEDSDDFGELWVKDNLIQACMGSRTIPEPVWVDDEPVPEVVIEKSKGTMDWEEFDQMFRI